ncbi:MAG TPA: SPASM domain-containing protein [Tepidisphaeraceae bacterium]|nr:SPASM domain-containing protein [Tepidisphaeraceae bacterium]
MPNVSAVISMLHEPSDVNSATRLFRRQPVLGWTLQRLWMCHRLNSIAVLCWEDQLPQVQPLASERQAHILAKHPRQKLPAIQSIAASRRWADGWRGGLLSTCDFDLGFHAEWTGEIIEKLSSQAVILVDPSAGLVDPKIIAAMVDEAESREHIELFFTQAAPGLAGALLRSEMVKRLADAKTHPGKVLHYLPDQPMRDPIGGESCVAVPTAVARTRHNFRLDSDRQIGRLTHAAVHLNGELMKSDAEDLLSRLRWTSSVDLLPQEIVLEINTNRNTSPIFSAASKSSIQRPNLSLEIAERIFDQIGSEVRVTLAGVGDPLLHEQLFDIIASAKNAGVKAIHLETDLLPNRQNSLDQLAESEIDVVSIHLPAMTAETYAAVMGVDQFMQAINNIQYLQMRRQQRGLGVPILSPLFAKCKQNLAEMEAWYDQWLRALGAAVIVGPTDFAGLIPDSSLADMSPPQRKPCNRINSRMTILSDGNVVSCEQDVTARQVMGHVSSNALSDIWQSEFDKLRIAHKSGCHGAVCSACREWHRP